MTRNLEQDVTADAFLWGDPTPVVPSAPPTRPTPIFTAADLEIMQGDVIDLTPIVDADQILPPGMFNQWPLDVLLQITKPFTGLVILIDLATTHRRAPRNESLLKLITGCVAGFLGGNDFGCRTSEDEFVMVCPGLDAAEAQRRLNQISELIWQFQQSGNGTFSLLFSWGGIGASEQPLSASIAAAVHRMDRINRNRNRTHTESVNHRRKVV